jgi:hypothetical protein
VFLFLAKILGYPRKRKTRKLLKILLKFFISTMREKVELSTVVKKFQTRGLAPVYSIETRYITKLVFLFISI